MRRYHLVLTRELGIILGWKSWPIHVWVLAHLVVVVRLHRENLAWVTESRWVYWIIHILVERRKARHVRHRLESVKRLNQKLILTRVRIMVRMNSAIIECGSAPLSRWRHGSKLGLTQARRLGNSSFLNFEEIFIFGQLRCLVFLGRLLSFGGWLEGPIICNFLHDRVIVMILCVPELFVKLLTSF